MPQLFLSSFNYSNFFLGISVSKEFIKVTCPMSQIKMATLKEVLQIFAVSLNNVRRTVSGSRGTWTRFDFSSPMTGGRSSASLAQACCPLIATFWPPTHNHIRQSCSFIISNNKVAMFEFCCLHYLHAPLSVGLDGLLIGPNMCLRLWYSSWRKNKIHVQCF